MNPANDITCYTRFNVVGSSGSGKSMVAKALAASLGLAFFEMDALFWRPNWEESSDEEFLPKLEAALGGAVLCG